MYLKRLELFGFKTFSQKTEIEFPKGFLAVVGPNGSGKSNLTDAIRFCLGEGSVKAMRATKLEELVFAGTPNRKGAPYAEVTAVFDNSDQALPVELSEVAITRRLDQDGDSKFYINKASCRLKDVHEMLMGSGIGPGSFSVLGGKEVDQVLSTDPKDRRAMLEETAGVNRYKFRKREAQRRLEKTAANLTRLKDIQQELEAQLEESKKQLSRYEKYKQAQLELKQLESELALNEWVRLQEKHARLLAQVEQAQQSWQQSEDHLAQMRQNLEGLSEEKRRLDEERERKSQIVSGLREQLGVTRANQEAVFQRATQLEHTAKSALQRLENACQRLEDCQKELQVLAGKLPALKEQAESSLKSLTQARQEMEELPLMGQGPHAELRLRQNNLEKEHNGLLGRRETLRARQESDLMRQLELMELQKQQRKELESLGEQSDPALDFKAQLEEAFKLCEEAKLYKTHIDKQLEQIRQERKKLEQDRRPLVSRVAEFEALLEDRSGLPPAVRSVLSWREPGTVGIVGELIKVPQGLEQAFEAALGGHMNDVITKDRKVASRLIERLKEERIGRVTFWPLDLERQPPPPPQLPDRRGVVGAALELLGYPKEIETVLAEILGRTVVMEDLPMSLQLYDRCRGRRPHLVTKQGEYLNPSGALTGGSLRNQQGGLLSRKRLLDEARSTLSGQEQRLRELQEKEDRLLGERQAADEAAQAAQENSRQLKSSLADLEAEHRRHQTDLERLRKGLQRAEEELAQILERDGKATDELNAAEERLRQIAVERAEVEEGLKRYQAEEARLQAQRESLQRRLVDTELDYERKKAALQEVERECARQNARREELIADQEGAEAEHQSCLEDRVRLEQEGLDLNRVIAELDEQAQTHAAELEAMREGSQGFEKQYQELYKEAQNAEASERQASHKLNALQVEFASVQAHVEEAIERLGGRPDEDQLPAAPMPAEELEKTRQRANRARNFLENFGSVNLGAQEDHDRLTARFDEMSTQIADLEAGAASLKQIMDEMDQVTVAQFREAFARVNETFGRVFTDLFNGGTARLELCDPEDLLETGVEIVACPPGKRLQNLTLLSSGERALSAMAFLLSLLSCKPSPIVILDELDAPLDDSNVERVASRLLEFSSSSQFLVITHNRKTMEFADRLYGVTMEEPGCSRILSVKITQDGSLEPEKVEAAHG